MISVMNNPSPSLQKMSYEYTYRIKSLVEHNPAWLKVYSPVFLCVFLLWYPLQDPPFFNFTPLVHEKL